MAAPLEFWLVREDRFGGHNCRGFHPLLQGYLCCRSLFSLSPGCRGGSSPGSGDILQGRQDPARRGAGIAEAVPREALLGRAQGAAGLRAHITSCQDMSRSWLSALALLKQGKLLFVKCPAPLSSPGLQSHRTAWGIAQLSKLIYQCVICREVLWLGRSLVLW